MSTELPPLPREDRTLSENWLRYIVQLDIVLRQHRAELDDHDARIKALEP